MAYDKQTWQSGDVVTSAKLNHMEDGIAGSSDCLAIGLVWDDETQTESLDKTWNQINTAMRSGVSCFIMFINDLPDSIVIEHNPVSAYAVLGDTNTYGVTNLTSQTDYVTDSPDGYPIYQFA